MHIVDHASRFIRVLAKKKLLAKSPLQVVEIGLNSEPSSYWSQYGASIRIHRFEPDAAVAARLQSKAGKYPVEFHCHAMALAAPSAERFEDSAAALSLGPLDFLRADMLAGGMRMLEGLGKYLEQRHILGFDLSFEFSPATGMQMLADMEGFLRGHGYRLYDLELIRSSYEEMHYPVAWDHRDAEGNAIFGPTTRGPLSHGKALLFKDIESDEFLSDYQNNRYAPQILKMASLFTLYNLSDCAARILIEHRPFIDPLFPVEDFLDLLVPDHFGLGLSYREYKEAYIRHAGRPVALKGRLPMWKRKTG